MFVCLALLPSLASAATSRMQSPGSNLGIGGSFDVLSGDMASSSNAVTRGFYGVSSATQQTGEAIMDTTRSITDGVASVGSATLGLGSTVVSGVTSGVFGVFRMAGSGAFAVVRGIGNGVLFVVRLPGNAVRHASAVTLGSAIIKPADNRQAETIDTSLYAFAPQPTATLAAAKQTPVATTAKPTSQRVVWPMHGAVTTLFGVPEPPYQPIHTGIDISDGAAPGVTPIHPFKAGIVTATIYSYSGLGNHVIVDHGSGLTSVYAHLDSIAVKKGQKVTTTSTVGREGTTGVSTGVHLHFEIRVNGTPVDPRNYISGHP